jgi:pyruvate dehydrogenase E2 component (dihydrolipoamide acetyltransferase)
MARWEFKLPDIGEGVTEGEIVAWHVKAGDVVKEDAPMVEVMTDKATVTITSPRAGKIVEVRGDIGSVVAVHSVMVVFELDGAADASANGNTNGHAKRPEPAATAVGDIKETLPGLGARAPASSGGGGGGGALEGYWSEKPLATPATRKLARDMNIDLHRVRPTGPQGRVTKKDVESFAHAPPAQEAPQAEKRPPPNPEATKIASHGMEERVPFAGMRRKIAQKMAQSKHTAAHFTFVEECDASALKELRARLKPKADARGVKLSYLPFIVKAVVAALKKHPTLNSALDEATNEIVFRKYYNIGIAASTDAGLMVPVVKDVDRRSLLDVAREIERLANDAKSGKAKVEDLQGSTFTITSLGADGGLFATPIINYPEVGILGVHQIKQKPVVKEGQIVVGDVMLLSLSFDHRLVDGHVGAAFAYEVIRYLEDPEVLLLEI